jgi:DNA-binding XRE family transcriptional regulator
MAPRSSAGSASSSKKPKAVALRFTLGMKDFASQLSQARNRRGLTQQDAADLLGISLRSYGELERGRTKPKLFEMAGMLGVLQQKPTTGKETGKTGA